MYRCDLSLLIIRLKALGIKNVWEFKYLNQPTEQEFVKALEVLYSLKAIDNEAELTPGKNCHIDFSIDIGMKLVELPVDPKLGASILASNSEEFKCTDEILSIAALMTVGNLFQNGVDSVRLAKAKKKLGALEGDHITLLNIFHSYCRKNKNARRAFCGEFYLNPNSLIKAVKIKSQLKQYLNIMKVEILKSDDYDDPPSILKSLICGFFTNIAMKQIDETYKNIRSNDILEIHPASVLANIKPKFVIYNDLFIINEKPGKPLNFHLCKTQLKLILFKSAKNRKILSITYKLPTLLKPTYRSRTRRPNKCKRIHARSLRNRHRLGLFPLPPFLHRHAKTIPRRKIQK